METLDVPPSYPPPPPPKKTRPKITLQIPDTVVPVTPRMQTTSSVYRGPLKYHGKMPGTPASHISDPYLNPFLPMYHNKASEFLFKQFEGFKDFTMNTAKSGLSAGEKTAFWLYNKLRLLSRKWFTHFFLTLCLVLYSIMGAAIFMTLEGPHEVKYDKNLTEVRRILATKIQDIFNNETIMKDPKLDLLNVIADELVGYEVEYTECMKHLNNHDVKKKTWTFWNSMFYAGTIYTTIGKTLRNFPGNIKSQCICSNPCCVCRSSDRENILANVGA